MPNTMREYKVQRLLGHWQPEFIEAELNKLGEDNWEAVGLGMDGGWANGRRGRVLLKRQIAPRS